MPALPFLTDAGDRCLLDNRRAGSHGQPGKAMDKGQRVDHAAGGVMQCAMIDRHAGAGGRFLSVQPRDRSAKCLPGGNALLQIPRCGL